MKTANEGPATAPAKKNTDPQAGALHYHPLALAFPRMAEAEMEHLVQEIRLRGSHAPFLRRQGVILDDFNRIAACQRAGVPVVFREWDGSGSLAELIVRAILPHSHLTDSQRAIIAVPMCQILAQEARQASLANLSLSGKRGGEGAKTSNLPTPAKTAFSDELKDGVLVHRPLIVDNCLEYSDNRASSCNNEEGKTGRVADRAAAVLGISATLINLAIRLCKRGDPKVCARVSAGQLSVQEALLKCASTEREAKLPRVEPEPDEQEMEQEPDEPGAAKIIAPKLPSQDQVIVGDCLEEMATLPDAAIPLIFADPPYNIGKKYHADPTHDLLPEARYLAWCEEWIGECKRLLSPKGSIFVMIDSRSQGPFVMMMRDAGLHWRSTIVWHDTFPNCLATNFQPAARFIHYFTRSPKTFTWNPDAIRVPSRRDELGDARRVSDKGIVPHDVWDGIARVPGNAKDRVPFTDAPPQVPAAILQRIILCASNPGDRVFDPFTGNGTTWREAKRLGRKFLGTERSPLYAEQARRWGMS